MHGRGPDPISTRGSRSDTQGQTWNGQSWTIVTTPNGPVSTTLNYLVGVDCLTDWACVTVGDAFDGTNHNPLAAWAPIARSGYRFVASDGGIFAYGAGAPFLGSLGGTVLNQPIVGMAVMPAGDGYYLVAADGGVFSYGSALFHGSTGSMHLNKPIVGMALTADGEGYWLVASDGGIFAFGDAQFYGSTGSIALNKPVVGMASTPNGLGYFLVASDGGIFNYGNAHFAGSTGSIVLNKPVVGLAVTTSGGYFLVASDGGIFAYGGAVFAGSTGSIDLNKPIVGMTTVAERLLPLGIRRRHLHLPDVGRAALLRLHGVDRPQQAHRGRRVLGVRPTAQPAPAAPTTSDHQSADVRPCTAARRRGRPPRPLGRPHRRARHGAPRPSPTRRRG